MENNSQDMANTGQGDALRCDAKYTRKDHATSKGLMERTRLEVLHSTVATLGTRYMGHILHLPTTRPLTLSVESWAAEDGKKRRGRPKKTWVYTMNDDLKERGMDWIGKICHPFLEIVPNIGFSLHQLFNIKQEELCLSESVGHVLFLICQ